MLKLVLACLSIGLGAMACSAPSPSADPAAQPTGRLEAGLVAFEALDRAAAHEAYVAMTLGEQADLWRAAFDRELASGELTEAQAAIVLEMRDDAEACLASKTITEAYQQRLLTVMTPEEINRYASSLGAHGQGIELDMETFTGNARQPAACTQNLECNPCVCHSYGPTCWAYSCPACTVTDGGCGPFGWFDCDGSGSPTGNSCPG